MKRVCLVFGDTDPVLAPEVELITARLARALTSLGYSVTVLSGDRDQTRMAGDRHLKILGVDAEIVKSIAPVRPAYLRGSYAIYQHLKSRTYDLIVFPDNMGLGFCSVVARRAGLAFSNTKIVILSYGPTAWLRQANRELKLTAAEFAISDMERQAVEGADALVGPSAYLHRWMAQNEWQLPRTTRVIPWLTPSRTTVPESNHHVASAAKEAPGARPTELVFAADFEHRNGIALYIEALNRVDPSVLKVVSLTFLGREVSYGRGEIAASLSPQVRGQISGLRFRSNLELEQNLRYLHGPGRITVVPALDANSPLPLYESLQHSLPLLAAATGGIPELVSREDHPSCLFEPEPDALAAQLQRALAGHRQSPVRPTFDSQTSLGQWGELLSDGVPFAWTQVRDSRSDVSIIVPHHDRPALMTATIETLAEQTQGKFEVVLVDDGSESAEAKEALASLEVRSWPFTLRVVRQANAYLGAARNAGVRAASGELLIFIDDDDLADTSYVETMVGAIEATGAGAVTCALGMFNADDQEGESEAEIWAFLGGNLAVAVTGNHLGGAGMIVRRSAWDAVGGFHERRGIGLEDYDFLVRLVMAGHEVIAIPEAPYRCRLSPGSMRSTMDTLGSAQMVLERFREKLPTELRPLVDLVHGQAAYCEENPQMIRLQAELDRRLRYQWLLERQLEEVRGQTKLPAREGE